jgi:TetR/AcrR family transcriptional regulator, transcriptional repressor for nem operon
MNEFQDKVSKQQLIDVAIELFSKKGYHNTSMSNIADACSIKKPSIYHHVDSRVDLLIAVVEQVTQRFADEVLLVLVEATLTAREKLQKMAEGIEAFFVQRQGDSLIAKLVYEVSSASTELQALLKRFFDQWVGALESLIKEYYGDNSKQIAEDSVAHLEGALLLSSINQDKGIFQRAINHMLLLIP